MRDRRFSRLIPCLTTLGLAITLSTCGPSEPSPEATPSAESNAAEMQRYSLRGKVVQLEAENQAATIDHEEIAGWMDAMTMRFPVQEKADWDKLSVGAQIEATVFVGEDGFHIGEIEVVGDEAPPDPEQP